MASSLAAAMGTQRSNKRRPSSRADDAVIPVQKRWCLRHSPAGKRRPDNALQRRRMVPLRAMGSLQPEGAVHVEPSFRARSDHTELADWRHPARGSGTCLRRPARLAEDHAHVRGRRRVSGLGIPDRLLRNLDARRIPDRAGFEAGIAESHRCRSKAFPGSHQSPAHAARRSPSARILRRLMARASSLLSRPLLGCLPCR